ncbi:MAG TPA: serine/threonine protein kinase [Cyanobacteria bacterium UBA11149]|nr:serine/threonine protein kinase [Cyanobacteria bacterium UBA11367]HBE59492.1 serine/threonine protein kinase [Cyanobacteria bacterium UBA11366]HBK66870.1 serine/threonine protein kinase [Cyanobacteria bacterium UBA11166]HBR76839.1 serine/threonine protein kinase [Cyanobacteria bacterium UBA11159]HBS72596.1 serine/threonine protein kinase [Cyanobacteria bacterium UBA11153]HBW90754.1 serine/threonine protein kinase [Cyanobacteria bacterium UBA11149]HCA93679.1 serine/threonine protein kinase 
MKILDYRITEQLYSGSRTQVYRGISESDEKPVVLKVLKSDYPTFNELVQFRHQYAIAKNLDLPGVVKHLSLEKYRNGFALVMEDFGGISLADYYLHGEAISLTDLPEFFAIAIQIVTTLQELYHHRIIHKDIKPQNILINPQTKQVKLIDFSISSLLPREEQEIQNPKILEGTLGYISPEQTGRMNRGIDYRTDFYSLGVTFYELLTGQLPFQSNDPMELVHCHIARQAIPPIEINLTIPLILNDILLKLMSKTAEDRYQTAFGLKHDLEKCLEQLGNNGSINSFDLGKRDISERFIIPEKLYGRETEVATLLTAFERISYGTSEMVLVAGFSGIGKTAVVNEVHKPIVRQRGYFIKGKFDQFQRDIPFSAWVQACQNLIRQILTESSDMIQEWRREILSALGENSQVIIDVIPELELVIGKQPPVPELEGSSAQNRFNLLFEKFIWVFATVNHPLVIFLDDLQWADSASLKLMQLLLSDIDTRYLLLLAAYRDNEVFPGHPLLLTLEEIRKASAKVNQITLAPLDLPNLNRLIADTLSCPPESANPLTETIFQKTKGNPFFSNQFLKFLYEDGLIIFDFNLGYWQCDIAKIRELSISDDVVEFMSNQLQKLPENTQNVLKLAACIGNQFDLDTLAIVSEKSLSSTAADLWRGLQEGLIVPISDLYTLYQDSEEFAINDSLSSLANHQSIVPYKFLHDRVQQAAYFLIPEDRKKSTHLQIGRLLLNNTPFTERGERIFDIVNQLNIGIELIDSQTERDELAQLNLIAGRKAQSSTAYSAAQKYLTTAMDLLNPNSWETQYNLTLAIYESGVETAYLSTDFELMGKWANIVLQKAKNILDKIKIYEVKIHTCMAQGKQLSAVKIGLQVLNLLGVVLPESPTSLDIQRGMEETSTALKGKKIEELINLPAMKDPTKLAAMRMLSSMFSPIYIAAPSLLPLIPCQQVNLSINYGNASFSAFGYANYAAILNAVVQDVEVAYQFGKLALNLVEKLNAKELKTKTFVQVAVFTLHWKTHIRETFPIFQQAYQTGLEIGDLEFTSYAAMNKCEYLYFSGEQLTEVEKEMTTYGHALAQIKQQAVLSYTQIFHQAVINLLFSTEDPSRLLGKAYNEENMLPLDQTANDRLGLHYFYCHKLILCYLFDDYPQALENAAKAELYLDGATGLFNIPVFHFYDSLTRLAIYPNVSQSEADTLLQKVTSNQEKMQKWADNAPMNHLHKFDLVEGEKHRVLGNFIEAINSYDRAIAGARDNEYTNEEALANEIAAKFYLAWGKEKIAQVYLTDAYYAYSHWGAKAKVEDLEKRYPQLLASILTEKINIIPGKTIAQTMTATMTSTGTEMYDSLDLATVIKASQALSGEINLSQLLSTLMNIVREHAGASQAVFILEIDGELEIYAQGLGKESNREIVPISRSNTVPVSAINYVWHTSETLVINNMSDDATFAADPYIIQHQPKSVICLPIQHQGKTIGILYLENHLTTGAFTRDRLELLNILSSQAAISIENARLYQTLEDKVKQRTAQLARANEQISDLNKRLKSENIRLSAELDLLKQMQQLILPKEDELSEIQKLDIAGFMEPANEVGGDYYDVLDMDGIVTIAIGDVTGHGLESGILMVMTQTAVRTLQEIKEGDPVRFLDTLNRTIYKNVQRMNSDKNLTLALLNYADGIISISGQHEEIIVVRKGGKIERIETLDLGFPIGLDAEIADFISQTTVELAPGDGVVLYTDGIPEAENIEKKFYGMERLCGVVSENWHLSAIEIKEAAIANLREFIGENKVFDDITLVVMKLKDEELAI